MTYTQAGSGGCADNTATRTVTITNCSVCNGTLTSIVNTDNQNICKESAISNITYTTIVATGISNNGISGSNGLPAGVSATWSNDTITISGTATTTGTFNYSITLTGGTCAGEKVIGKIIVTPKTIPTFSAIHSICSGDALSALPINSLNAFSGTWSPALDNTKTTLYTFTPTAGECATTKSMNIVVNTPPSVSVNNPTICNGSTTTLTATPIISGGKYKWSTGETTQTISVSPSATQQYYVLYSLAPDLLCNIDFEDVQITPANSFKIVNQSTVPCWKTTASDGMIEVWGNGFLGVPAYSGTQFIELNANEVATLYQDFKVTEGNSAKISFAHRGRNGVDVMSVEVGPVNGPFENIGTITTGNSNWSYHTIDYTFPTNGDSNYRIKFNSISSTGGAGVGNFLDAFSIVYSNCPSDTTFALVTVNPKSLPTFTAVSPVCYGTTIPALPTTSDNGFTGTWSPSLNNLATTTYTFTPTSGQCASTAVLTILVNSKPTIALGNLVSPSSCLGTDGSIELTGLQLNATYTVNYKKDNTPITNVLISDAAGILKLIGLTAGDYKSINVVLSGCNSNTIVGPVSLTDPTPPVPNAGGTAAICEGQKLSLSSDNPGVGATYSWSGPNSFTSTTQNPTVSLSATPTMSGTYSVVQTYLGCTSIASTVDIVVTPLPKTGVLSGSNPICTGVNTTYTSTVFGGTWASTNPAVASVNATTGVVTTFIPGNADITYTVTGTGGCSDVSNSKSIIVSKDYTISLLSDLKSDTQTVCLNTAIAPIEYTITDAIGVNAQNLPTGINANVVGNKITISGTPTQKGTFDYSIKATGGCGKDSVLGQINVGDMLTPLVNITSSDADNIICLGTSVTFTAHPTNGGTTPSYQWKLNGVDVFGEITNTYTKSTLVDGDKVSVLMTSNSACASPLTATSNSITTNIGNNVTPSFNAKAAICEDEIYSLPTTSIEGSIGTWSPAMNIKATTTYTFKPDIAGCYTSTTFTLKVNPLPIVNTVIGSTTVCKGTPTDVKITSTTPNSTFSWTATQTPNVTGANAGSGNIIAQVLSLTGNVNGNVDYIITPKAGLCVGNPKTVSLTVNPTITPSVSVLVTNMTMNATKDTVTLCPDDNVIFAATPVNPGIAPVYQWKVNNINVGTNSATYSSGKIKDKDIISVTMTSNQLCASPVTVTSNVIHAVVRANPLKITAGSTNSCNGSDGTITMKGDGVGDFSWKLGTVLVNDSLNVTISTKPNNPFVINKLSTGTYTVFFDNHTCIYKYPATVTEPSSPLAPSSITLSKPAPICKGDSVLLTAVYDEDPPSSYIWVKDGNDTLKTKTQSIWVKSAGNYATTIIMNGCISDPLDSNVTFIDQPTNLVSTNVTQPNCTVTSGSIDLTNLPAGSWKLSTIPALGLPISGSTSTYTLSNLTPGTTFAIRVQNSNGCFSDTILRKINPKLTPPTAPKFTTPSQPTCTVVTGSVNLSGLPTTNWTVTSTPITKTYTGNTSTLYVTGLKANTSYTFVVTDINGCSSTPSNVVKIDPFYGKPSKPSVQNPQTFCSNSKPTVAKLDYGNVTSPIWYKDTLLATKYNTSDVLVNNGKYYLSETVKGCESYRVLVTAKLNNGPTLQNVTPVTFCTSDKKSIKDLQSKIGTNATLAIYNGLVGGVQLPITDTLAAKTYYYEADSASCTSLTRQSVIVLLNDGTLPTFNTTNPTVCASKNMTFGDLSKELGSTTGLLWYATNHGGVGNVASDKVSYPPMKQTYYVAYKPQPNSCESKDRIKVTVTLLLAPADVTLKEHFYEPCTDAKETVANLPTAPYLPNTIAWFADPNSINPLKSSDPLYSSKYYAAAYNIDVTSGKKCYSTTRDAVDVHLYTVAFIAHPENTICEKATGVITIVDKEVHGYAPYTYVFKDPNGIVVGNTAKTEKLKEGDYTIEVTDAKNCKHSITEHVGCTIKDIPHILTPDGDGKNDTWIIRYYEKYPTVQVTVFNRWGSKVYTSEIPYMDNWDGKASEDINTIGNGYLPAGTYFYMIDKGNGEAIESGYIELVK